MSKPPGPKNGWVFCSSGLLVAVLLSGCASTTQFVRCPSQTVPLEDPEKARVYVVRTAFAFNIASHNVPVRVGPKEIGYRAGHSYLCWERKQGEARIHSSAYNSKTLQFKVQKGKVYHVLQHRGPVWDTLGQAIVMPGGGNSPPQWSSLTKKKAERR
jgi:hypothetical protein